MSRKALGPSDPPQTPKLFELRGQIRARPCDDPVQSAGEVVSHCQWQFASCAQTPEAPPPAACSWARRHPRSSAL